MKRRGSNYERELLDCLWNAGFRGVRVAGSGSTQRPAPDILALNFWGVLAIESKTTKELPPYIKKNDVEQLMSFSNHTSELNQESIHVKPLIALKLPRQFWRFYTPKMLRKTQNSYVVNEENYETGYNVGNLHTLLPKNQEEVC